MEDKKKEKDCGCKKEHDCGCEHDEKKECDCKECDCEKETKDEKENIENTENDSKEQSKEEIKEKDELTLAKEKIVELEDKYKRLLAEFDNFRKRSEKENMQMCDMGTSMALTKILPIVDNIERALQNIPEDLKNNAFVEGVDKTYKQILKTFEEMDVKPIEAKGKTFDQKFHNAVMTDEESDAEVDTITEELQKGYMYKDTVLRHSMVKVKK